MSYSVPVRRQTREEISSVSVYTRFVHKLPGDLGMIGGNIIGRGGGGGGLLENVGPRGMMRPNVMPIAAAAGEQQHDDDGAQELQHRGGAGSAWLLCYCILVAGAGCCDTLCARMMSGLVRFGAVVVTGFEVRVRGVLSVIASPSSIIIVATSD